MRGASGTAKLFCDNYRYQKVEKKWKYIIRVSQASKYISILQGVRACCVYLHNFRLLTFRIKHKQGIKPLML